MDLREAVDRDEFFLVYQPTFDLCNMRPTAVEALLRWNHPTRGVVQPNDFIPLLEETGLIADVGRWVLNEACRQAVEWRNRGRELGVAVNVSGRQLDSDEFIAHVREALADSGMPADALTLEITETAIMRNVEATAKRLIAIKQLGVRIAIDDFGTGYSSLAHLQRFPVDALKIDRSFTARLTQNPEGETLVHTLVQLGKALSIETLAEGIEQQQELSVLREEHCDGGQGFLFAHPLDAAGVEIFFESWPAQAPPRAAGELRAAPSAAGERVSASRP
jgi:EAL domain-containing protein (putative c-di-GMP-specific phosphodiesterase class I)